MNRPAVSQFRRPGTPPPTPASTALSRLGIRLGLVALGTGLLTAAVEGLYPLGYLALVPWLLALAGPRSNRWGLAIGWLGGVLFFSANGWWIFRVNGAGGTLLILFMGLYWGAAALVFRGLNLLRSPAAGQPWHRRWGTLLVVPTVWVGVEFVRGTWPWHGLPVMLLAYTQSPAPVVCQIADITGAAGVSFVVALVNTALAMWVTNRLNFSGLVGPITFTAAVVASTIGYGLYRFSHEPARFAAGPRVMVVQSNFAQRADGDKGVAMDTLIRYHLKATREALKTDGSPDLVLWSETMMPPLNEEAVANFGGILDRTRRQLEWVAFYNRLSLITGGISWTDIHGDEPRVRSNCTYLFSPDGKPCEKRYDKIDLVPFGEFIPFETTAPPLYRLAVKLSPPDVVKAMMTAGRDSELTTFPVPFKGQPVRVVTPICFEDSDAGLCARMFRPDTDTPQVKRADVLANVSNDGWFAGGENWQHLESAVFRSIENRVPSARSVNTGISGFIDPLGRSGSTVAAGTAGVASADLQLDDRVTVFTRVGPMFGKACAVVTGVLAITGLLFGLRPSRSPGQ